MHEKDDVVARLPPAARRSVLHWFVWSILVVLALAYPYKHSSVSASQHGMAGSKEDHTHIWDMIVPSPNLRWWTPCYNGKECAKILVPLDYSDPSGPRTAIAILKIPSKITDHQPGYRGPIIFNWGNPDTSGISFMNREGLLLQSTLGDAYDLVSFDPRGIGFSEPKPRLSSNFNQEAAWYPATEAIQPLNATPGAFLRQRAVLGDLAAYPAQCFDTELLARDMKHIAWEYGESRAQFWGFPYDILPEGVFHRPLDGAVCAAV